MTKKEKEKLKKSFNIIAGIVNDAKCSDLHHIKKHQHSYDKVCPARLEAIGALVDLYDFMKSNGI